MLLTHDANTMPAFAFERIRRDQPMAGVFVVVQDASPAIVIDDLILLVECSQDSEWQDQVLYIPLP